MKRTLLSLFATMLIAITFGQQPNYIVTQNQDLKMELDNGVIKIYNLQNKAVKVALTNTVEDTISLNKHGKMVLHELQGKQYIRAVLVGNDCGNIDCGLILQTDCNLLPIIVSNFNAKRLSSDVIEVSFDAYNTGGQQGYFIASYSLDNGKSWQTVRLDLPEVTGIMQHFVKTFKID